MAFYHKVPVSLCLPFTMRQILSLEFDIVTLFLAAPRQLNRFNCLLVGLSVTITFMT